MGSGLPLVDQMVESACNARDPGSIPGLERSPGEGNGNLLRYSCLENSMDREAWQATYFTSFFHFHGTEDLVLNLIRFKENCKGVTFH